MFLGLPIDSAPARGRIVNVGEHPKPAIRVRKNWSYAGQVGVEV